jgi:hypothetical protein
MQEVKFVKCEVYVVKHTGWKARYERIHREFNDGVWHQNIWASALISASVRLAALRVGGVIAADVSK